jgi:hypothetical protein
MSDTGGATRAAAAVLLRGEACAGPHLQILDGPDTGCALPLGTDQTIGRGRAADLRIPDPAASRLHARITCEAGRVLVCDRGSKNGLRINGERCVRPRLLSAGDELSIGATRLRFAPGLLASMESTPPPGATRRPVPDAPPRDARHATALLAAAAALLALGAVLWVP